MTDTTTPDDSGTQEQSERSLADWMRITQRAFMHRVADEVRAHGVDPRAAMAAKFRGQPNSPEAEKLAETVASVQAQATASIPAEDLAATLRTLEAIARELGWDESQPNRGPWEGRGPGFGPGGWFGPWQGFDPRRGFGPGRGFHPGRSGAHAEFQQEHGGADGRGHDHGRHPKQERAYERGFEAGFDAAHRHHAA